MPRSAKDHLSNSLAFGPDGALYLNQGGNSAMGAPDGAWSNRAERALSAAVLRINPRVGGGVPINVKTEDGNAYNPNAAGAPVTVYGEGIRNAYDLVWHTDGSLYVPTNGSAGGCNTPGSPTGVSPVVPAINSAPTQNDFLFQVVAGGYYGHPNPWLNHYAMNDGNPSSGVDPAEVVASGVHNGYPVGVQPDADYQYFAWDFGRNRSPNGAIEYRSDTFGGALQGKLMVVEYSGGDRILVLSLGSGGNIAGAQELEVPEGFSNPLDLIADIRNGFIYTTELVSFSSSGANNQISVLRPHASAASGTTGTAIIGNVVDDAGTWPMSPTTYLAALLALLAALWACASRTRRGLGAPAPARKRQRREGPKHAGIHLALAIFLGAALTAGTASDPLGQDEGTLETTSAGGSSAMVLDAELDGLPPTPAFIELSQITLDPGAVVELIVPGPEVYAVESGALSIRVSTETTVTRGTTNGPASSPEVAVPNIDTTLRAGDQIAIGGDTQHTLRNDASEPTSVLSLVIFPAAFAVPDRLRDSESPPGTRIDRVLSTVIEDATPLPPGPVRLELHRLGLAPGAKANIPDEREFALLALESGIATIIVDDAESSVAAGEALQLAPAASMVIEHDGEDALQAFVLTIPIVSPDNRAATPEASPMTA